MLIEASYPCSSCGEEIVVMVDPSGGEQTYVEDCPVCCRPVVLRVELTDAGEASLHAEAE
jgi:hypothetical protein